MIKVTEFAYTAYPVTDLARAKRFYEGVLGLKATTTMGDDTQAWIEYEVGGSTLAISNMGADKWQPNPQGPSLAIEVDDFATAMADLISAGAKVFLEPMESPVCFFAVVSDPDGNSLMIHKRKA